jgi:hypothetical protein
MPMIGTGTPTTERSFWFKDRPVLGRLFNTICISILLYIKLKISNPWLHAVVAIAGGVIGTTLVVLLIDFAVRSFLFRSSAR